MIGSKWFYPILFNENFTQSAAIFNVYLLLIASRFVFPQSILIAKKENKLLFTVSVIELTINILLSVILMLKLGIIGIAYGTVIAFAIEKMIFVYLVKVKWQISIHQYIPIRVLLTAIILLILTFTALIPN